MLPSITQLAQQLRSRQTTVHQLLATCRARMERLEPDLQAWVMVDIAAAERDAERLQAELDSGHDRGPLHGIPLGIKDLIDVAGWPTRAGSPLTAATPASADAPLIARLRAAGAILLGKTVTTQWAAFDPPVTRNPWNATRTPGGSSSGSAVAVATGMCVAAIGSQTGGSIIRPASYCGVAGFKPSFGRVPVEGVIPFATHLDHVGPLARSADDLSIIAAILSGDQVPCFESTSGAPAALVLYQSLAEAVAQPAVVNVWRGACAQLAAARGAKLVPREFPADFATIIREHRRLMEYEAAQFHRARYTLNPTQFAPRIGSVITAGLQLHQQDYQRALAQQADFRMAVERQLGDDTVALLPATTTTAPLADTTGDPSFNSPWSFAGAPTVTLPCGLAEDGLPVGLQLIAAPGCDDRLLETARWCEVHLREHARAVRSAPRIASHQP